MNPLFHLVLFAPEIPGNTGTLGRTCLALNQRLILIRPLGFNLDEKSLRRAGLDYWKDVDVTVYENFSEFLKSESPSKENLFFFSKKASKSLYHTSFKDLCPYLVFGAETKGLPEFIFEEYPQQLLSLPLYNNKVRSLNLASAATATCYEVIRQKKFS